MATRQLLGPDGEPIRKEALLEEVAAPTLSGVRRPISGHPSSGLTPGRLAALLRASEEGDPEAYLALAEDIEEKDLHYLGVMGTRKRAVSGVEAPAGGDAAGLKERTVAAARALCAREPDIGGLVLEGGRMCRHARAVHDATGLPVFDALSMTRFLKAGARQDSYSGYY